MDKDKDYEEINKEDLEAIEEMAEGHIRHLTGFHQKAFVTVAIGWSLFQLALPQFLLLSSIHVRSGSVSNRSISYTSTS